MSAEDNKAIVRKVIGEVLNRGNLALIDELFASTYVSTALWPDPRKPSGVTATQDLQILRQGGTMLRAALPDATTSIDEITAEGDLVMVCTTTRGTHTGAHFFDVPASGKTLQWTTFTISRIAGGKIVDRRNGKE